MKRLVLLLGCGLFLSFVYSFLAIPALALSVRTIIPFSDQADTPSVIDSTSAITLTFSEPLNPSTVTDGVKLYRVISTGNLTEVPCKTTFNNNTPVLLNVIKQDGAKFAEGEEYKIVISGAIKSTNGTALRKDIAWYFATNYSFHLESDGMPELNGTRQLIICISDIQEGGQRTIDGGYNMFEKNKPALVNFLKQIRLAPNVKELVIAGDMLDEWVGPMGDDPLNGMTEAGFVDSIVAANQTVTDAVNNIIKDGKIKVTYIPGNHDILVTAEDMERNFPGISQARDAEGLGAYTPVDHPEIIIEHGHRYEFFCAPDPISNRSITNTNSILPPGFFLTRVGYSSIIEHAATGITVLPPITINAADMRQYLYSLYWGLWKNLTVHRPITDGLNDKIIKTGIDGYTETYAINDFVPDFNNGNGPVELNLYQGMMDTWDERQTINQTPVHYSVQKAVSDEKDLGRMDFRAFDGHAIDQYFLNPASNKRIVVFGHSHVGCIKPSLNLKNQKTVYANSGTWQAMPEPIFTPMTFVVITPEKTSDSTPEFVTLYQYSQNGTITKMKDQAAITNLPPDSSVKIGARYK